LDRIVARLGLSPFERDILLLAASVELDGDVAALTARLQGGQDPRPTFALALNVLSGPHWDAISPDGPLRRWGLVDLSAGPTLTTRPLTLDEHILHELTGIGLPGASLGQFAVHTRGAVQLTASQAQAVDELAAAVATVAGPAVVRVDGEDAEARVGVAIRLADRLGLNALVLREEALPEAGPELARTALLVDREALVHDVLPVLASDRLLDLLGSPWFVVLDDGPAVPGRTIISRNIGLPTAAEQVRLWTEAITAHRTVAPGARRAAAAMVTELSHHYRLPARSIAAIAGEWAVAARRGTTAEEAVCGLRRLTRERARVGVGLLAQRIETRAGWQDLVLPEGQLMLLQDLVRQVRHRSRVYQDWGFADKSSRGLGVTALFSGESGTGKTMAAEVMAADLGLDLYRIDLSAVMSKYIGETEKNLGRLFDAAEASGAVLLFDEADALFGKRSETKDSHDRYANLEVAYLLQRMESYRGLAILTTNLRNNLDQSFTRRLRAIIQFPFPDQPHRELIWRKAFPPRTPVEGIDPAALSRLQVSGGAIRSIALGAAFAAADNGTPVRREHVMHAAKVEYAKSQRTLTATELAGLSGPDPRAGAS
jgi:vesicle-fusing ATPase